MGVYTRSDSPWFWLFLERKGLPGIRESTRLPARHANNWDQKDLRRRAEELYVARMADLARTDAAVARANGQLRSTVLKPLRRSPDGWCYVYIIRQGELVKIGRAVDVNKRLKTLQTGNGRGFQVLATIPAHAVIEAAIQSRFAHLREHGEWFRLDPDLSTFIERAQQGANPIALLWE